MKAKPKYIQIVDCGKFQSALWDFPNSHTFYPIHGDEENCIQWALSNGYELITDNGKRMVWKLSPQ